MFVGVRMRSLQHQLEDLRQMLVVGEIEENTTVLKGREVSATVEFERTDANRSLLNVLWRQTSHKSWIPQGNWPFRRPRRDLGAEGRP